MIEKYEEMLSILESEFENDNLFKEIRPRRDYYQELISEDFISYLDVKKWYSTVEAAEMFNISDSKLRYYIKPLLNYVLSEDTPSSSVAYRLNYASVFKLKMILLLKDEFKVAGIQTLIGIRGSIVNASDEKGLNLNPDLADRVKQLETLLSSIIQTGIFTTNGADGQKKLEINSDYFKQQNPIALIETEEFSTIKKEVHEAKEQISELKQNIEKEREEKEKLREKLKKLEQFDDVAYSFRQNQKAKELEIEALEEWDRKNKGVFKKLLSTEASKAKFVMEYVKEKQKNNEKV